MLLARSRLSRMLLAVNPALKMDTSRMRGHNEHEGAGRFTWQIHIAYPACLMWAAEGSMTRVREEDLRPLTCSLLGACVDERSGCREPCSLDPKGEKSARSAPASSVAPDFTAGMAAPGASAPAGAGDLILQDQAHR